MKINLAAAENQVRSETVNLGEAGEFFVTVKNPTYGELIRDMGTIKNYHEERMRTVIVGWSGLMEDATNEAGEPIEREIPFTWENFQKVCSLYPAAFRRCVMIANDAFTGGEASKNVKAAFTGFSADAVLQQLGAKSGSPYGSLPPLPAPPGSVQQS